MKHAFGASFVRTCDYKYMILSVSASRSAALRIFARYVFIFLSRDSQSKASCVTEKQMQAAGKVREFVHRHYNYVTPSKDRQSERHSS